MDIDPSVESMVLTGSMFAVKPWQGEAVAGGTAGSNIQPSSFDRLEAVYWLLK